MQGLLDGGGAKAKATSAENALQALTEEKTTLFVDIRSTTAAKEEGSPALGRIKGKALTVPYFKVRSHSDINSLETPCVVTQSSPHTGTCSTYLAMLEMEPLQVVCDAINFCT